MGLNYRIQMKPVFYLLLGLFLVGCTGQSPKFPWSLEGIAVPSFKEVSRSDHSIEGYVNHSVNVATEARTRDDLELIAKKVIETVPPHNAVMIFFYRDTAEAKDNQEFTVGRASWGVEEYIDTLPKPGDYSKHKLQLLLPGEKLRI